MTEMDTAYRRDYATHRKLDAAATAIRELLADEQAEHLGPIDRAEFAAVQRKLERHAAHLVAAWD